MKQTATPQAATTAVAVAPQGTALANIIPINGMEDISRLGVAVAKSGWFGTIGQSTGEMIAMTMLQERISPVTFKKKYHVMSDGSLSVASRARVSAFKRLGGKMKLHEVSKDKCDITFIYEGNELRHSVTLQGFIDNGVAVSAKTGAIKDNWAKFPGDMLYARCCSFAIPKVCPEADDGLYTTEEVADFDDAPTAPREPVKIDKSEVVSRIAKSEAKPTAPAVPSPAPAAEPEVVEAEVVETSVHPDPMVESQKKLATARAAKQSDQPVAPDIEATACPITGNFFNVPFSDMEPDILAFVLMPETAQRHPELTPAHVEAAKAAARAKGMEV